MLIFILQKGRPITQLPKRAQRDVLADNDEVGGESSPREHCSFRPWRWPVAGGRQVEGDLEIVGGGPQAKTGMKESRTSHVEWLPY